MEEWVERKLRAPLEVIALFAPGYSFSLTNGESVFRIHANACWRLFVEGSQEAVKAFFAHHQPRFTDKILW
jgi:hypothetical protein